MYYYIIAFAIGFVIAIIELNSRYKIEMLDVFKVKASYLYFSINGVVSLFCYWFVLYKNYTFGGLIGSDLDRLLITSISSMFLLRSSFINLKIDDHNVAIGLAALIQELLNKVDREFDQGHSFKSLPKVKEIMSDIDFDKAMQSLPTTCLSLMQSVSLAEQKRIGEEVAKLNDPKLDNDFKSLSLGIVLNRVTGIILLKKAVETLGNSIKYSPNEKIWNVEGDEITKKVVELKDKLK